MFVTVSILTSIIFISFQIVVSFCSIFRRRISTRRLSILQCCCFVVLLLFVVHISFYGGIESKTMFECIASALRNNLSAVLIWVQCGCIVVWLRLHCGCIAVALRLHCSCIRVASNIQKGVILHFSDIASTSKVHCRFIVGALQVN